MTWCTIVLCRMPSSLIIHKMDSYQIARYPIQYKTDSLRIACNPIKYKMDSY